MSPQMGYSHGACEVHGPRAHHASKQKFEFKYCSFLLVKVMPCLAATFNILLKLSEHSGSTSRETAVAIFQEMLHIGIGMLPFCRERGGARRLEGYVNLSTKIFLLQSQI